MLEKKKKSPKLYFIFYWWYLKLPKFYQLQIWLDQIKETKSQWKTKRCKGEPLEIIQWKNLETATKQTKWIGTRWDTEIRGQVSGKNNE